MADGFNQMVDELRLHRSRLEQMVQERTVKLKDSRRKLEQLTAYFRAAYESIIDGILIVEWPSGQVIATNHHFSELIKRSESELIEMTADDLSNAMTDLFVEARGDAFRWEYYIKNAEEVAREEWELSSPSKMILSVYSGPVVGGQGQVFARLWMFRDMTQQRVLEAELMQAQKMEAIGRLAGGIAHDFNNLLTGIIGNLTMAHMEMKPGGDPVNFLTLASQAAKRAAELVQQLLGFSRRNKLNLTECNINAIAHEVKALLQHMVDPRIDIQVQLEEALWSVSADATQLQQVLMNLCVNAVDAMPEGGRLTIRTGNRKFTREDIQKWPDAQPGEFVYLSVADSGHGMSHEVQNHIFEPFFTTKPEGKGTGLGLAMTYGIIKQHQGWIVCDSKLNIGTTFIIALPRAGILEAQVVEAVDETPIMGGAECVLVVDDEPAVRGVMTVVLQKYGYHILSASDGEEAIEIFADRQDEIGLVVLDLTMPKLSGREVFRKMRDIRAEIPVIISSGYSIDIDSFAEEEGGTPECFIQKPFELDALARMVREVLDGVSSSSNALSGINS